MKSMASDQDPLLLELAANLRSSDPQAQYVALVVIDALGVLARPLLSVLGDSRASLDSWLHPFLDAALDAVQGSAVRSQWPEWEVTEAPSLFEVLGEALHGKAAIRALHIIGFLGPVARPLGSALAERLASEQMIERVMVARLLGEIGNDDPKVIACLAEALDDSKDDVRAEAAVALSALGQVERANAVLRSLVKKTEGRGRLNAAFDLGKYCGEEAIAARVLGEALDDADPLSRSMSVRLLSSLKLKTAALVPGLVATLHDQDANIRSLVLDSLSAMGSVARSAVPAITKLLATEGDETVRQAAEAALTEISKDGPV